MTLSGNTSLLSQLRLLLFFDCFQRTLKQLVFARSAWMAPRSDGSVSGRFLICSSIHKTAS